MSWWWRAHFWNRSTFMGQSEPMTHECITILPQRTRVYLKHPLGVPPCHRCFMCYNRRYLLETRDSDSRTYVLKMKLEVRTMK